MRFMVRTIGASRHDLEDVAVRIVASPWPSTVLLQASMVTTSWILLVLATLAACYVAKLIVIDVGWRDHRVHRDSSTARTLAVCIAIALVVIALPSALGSGLITGGHPGWAIVVAIGSLVLSGLGFVVLANASRP
jgi:hypothetical protein